MSEDYQDRELEPLDPPTFFEELKLFLEMLNKEFADGIKDGKRRHNITLTSEGHLEITVWHFDKSGKLGTYYCRLEDYNDMFQSMDDVISDLRKYVEQTAE